jgi:KTSC domain
MTRELINSSAIASVGYNPASMLLEVEFKKSGDVWQYAPVSLETYLTMKDAAHSAGRTFFANVRNNPAVVATKLEPICTTCGGKYTCPEAVCPTYEAANAS